MVIMRIKIYIYNFTANLFGNSRYCIGGISSAVIQVSGWNSCLDALCDPSWVSRIKIDRNVAIYSMVRASSNNLCIHKYCQLAVRECHECTLALLVCCCIYKYYAYISINFPDFHSGFCTIYDIVVHTGCQVDINTLPMG